MLPALLLSMCLAPTTPVNRALAASASRLPAVSMMYKKTIAFSALEDAALCVSTVRRVAEQIASWDEADWALFGARKLAHRLAVDEAASDKIGGVVLSYFQPQYQDGALNIVVEEKPTLLGTHELVWRTFGSPRLAQEDVLYKLVLEEVRAGSLRGVCALAPGFYPSSARAARTARSVEERRLRGEESAAPDNVQQGLAAMLT